MAGGVPSRNLWQLIVSLVLAVILFGNHFMLTSEKRRKLWRVLINQIVILLILLLRVYQILANMISHADNTMFLIEVTIGLLAIVPTLDAVICVECISEAYKHS